MCLGAGNPGQPLTNYVPDQPTTTHNLSEDTIMYKAIWGYVNKEDPDNNYCEPASAETLFFSREEAQAWVEAQVAGSEDKYGSVSPVE
jgi:hypothetical protein